MASSLDATQFADEEGVQFPDTGTSAQAESLRIEKISVPAYFCSSEEQSYQVCFCLKHLKLKVDFWFDD